MKVFLFDFCLTTLFYVFLPFSFLFVCFLLLFFFNLPPHFISTNYLQLNPVNSNCQLKLLQVNGVSSCKGLEQDQKHLVKEVLWLYKFHWKISNNVRVQKRQNKTMENKSMKTTSTMLLFRMFSAKSHFNIC